MLTNERKFKHFQQNRFTRYRKTKALGGENKLASLSPGSWALRHCLSGKPEALALDLQLLLQQQLWHTARGKQHQH